MFAMHNFLLFWTIFTMCTSAGSVQTTYTNSKMRRQAIYIHGNIFYDIKNLAQKLVLWSPNEVGFQVN